MKRIWIAIILIGIAGGLCIFEQIYIREFCDTIIEYSERQDIEGIKTYWAKHNDTIYIFSHHSTLDSLGESIYILDDTDDITKESTFKEIESQAENYINNQKISLSNIF